MRKSDGTMKNTYEFLTDLHKEWGNLNKEQQTAIALEMGGKNQMEVFMATMNNFETAIEATNTAMGAQGSAAQENAKYLDSLKGHLANLQSAWEEFSHTILNSDVLKRGMDVLTNILHFLSSDLGQIVLWGTLAATTFNLIAKALLGIKATSIVQLATGFMAVTKEARLAGGAIGAVSLQSAKLDKAMAILTSTTAAWVVGIIGASAAISAGLILYDKYISKHDKFLKQQNEAIKATKEYKKAREDLTKIESRLQGVQSEIEQLKSKRDSGKGLTVAEQARLDLLLDQEESLKRQLELQEKIIQNKFEESEENVGKKGLTTTDFTKGRGKSAKEIWADKGVENKTDRAVYLHNQNLKESIDLKNKAIKAQKDYDEALRSGNKTQEELDKLEDKAIEAQKTYNDSQQATLETLNDLYAKKQEYLDVYGDEENIPDELQDSYKKLNKILKDNEHLMGISTDDMESGLSAIKDYGEAMGVIVDEAGNINSVNVDKFTESMTNAGLSTEEILTYLQQIQEENPDVKLTLDGDEYTLDQLKATDEGIKAVDGKVATATLNAEDNVTPAEVEIMGRSNLGKATKTIEEKGASGVQKKLDDIHKKSNLGSATKHINFSVSGLTAKLKSFLGLKTGIRHFAGGGANAEVNEQGFEIIQDGKTGMMRVVNGGRRGLTHINKGDSVYTHGQSVRMLRNAGLTEGQVVYGHGNNDFGLFGVKKLKGYKGGKLSQSDYNKKYAAIQSAMNSGVATLEYNRDYYNWTSAQFAEAYTRLYNEQLGALATLNSKKVKKGVKKQTNLGTDIIRAYNLAQQAARSEAAKKNIEDLIANTQGTDSDLSKMLNAINTASQANLISSEEAQEYRMKAYKQYVEYNLKQYQNDKETYAKSLALIKQYYAEGKLAGEDYYKYLDQIAKDQLDKEKSRLSEQQDVLTNTYDLGRAYVQRQIDLLQKENEEQQEQNQLIELQNNLAKARNQRVRIYKEGEGFVYEKDTEAIREATQALQDYRGTMSDVSQSANSDLAQWQAILDLFDDIEADNAIRRLEILAGSNVQTLFGGFGTNTSAWANWIKDNLSKTGGIQDVLNSLDKLVDANDIIDYLDSNGQVKDAVLQAAIANNILPQTYAAAVMQMVQGVDAVTNTTASIATQSAISTATKTLDATHRNYLTKKGSHIYNFQNLVLPNVKNAQDFIEELNNLPNMALQASTQRE